MIDEAAKKQAKKRLHFERDIYKSDDHRQIEKIIDALISSNAFSVIDIMIGVKDSLENMSDVDVSGLEEDIDKEIEREYNRQKGN